MKRFPYILVLVSIFTLACGSLAGLSPSPTPIATSLPPTNSPEPTFTPLPTDTATPLPTSTPDTAATQSAKATESASDVLAELDKYLGTDSDIPYKDGRLVWQQNKKLSLNLSGPDHGFLAIDDNLTAGDFIFKADVTWEASGILVCGAVFRSEANLDKGKQYMFSYLRLSGLPAWELDVNQYGNFQNSPSGFRTSGALDLTNGADNQFIIVAQANEFTIYINHVREGRFYDNSKQRSDGAFGFFGSQESGKGTCEVENAWVWSLDK
ncbi:MAG: hypothetical protein ABI904_03335 [Chloroflexota bacterium]